MKSKTQSKPAGTAPSPEYAAALQAYEGGIRAMHERKYDKAAGLFEKVLSGANREFGDRARVHLNACRQQAEKPSASFKSVEEQYDFAVSLINRAEYEEAREQLSKILSKRSDSDFAHYGLALVDCLTGNTEGCLRNLEAAIRMNPAARIQARNDSDFQRMSDDPRFTELLYPEPGESQSAD